MGLRVCQIKKKLFPFGVVWQIFLYAEHHGKGQKPQGNTDELLDAGLRLGLVLGMVPLLFLDVVHRCEDRFFRVPLIKANRKHANDRNRVEEFLHVDVCIALGINQKRGHGIDQKYRKVKNRVDAPWFQQSNDQTNDGRCRGNEKPGGVKEVVYAKQVRKLREILQVGECAVELRIVRIARCDELLGDE